MVEGFCVIASEGVLSARREVHSRKQLSNHISPVFLIASASDTSCCCVAIENTFENRATAEQETVALEDDAL